MPTINYDMLKMVKTYSVPDTVRDNLLKEAKKRAEIDTERGIKRKEYSDKYKERWLPDFYGLHGEYAVEQLFIQNSISYQPGEKFETITHDFLILNPKTESYINIGVKTIPIFKSYNIVNYFQTKPYRNVLFYPVRKQGALSGHLYPDYLFYCIYFPKMTPNEVSILGYIDNVTLTTSKVYYVHNKQTYFISLFDFRDCNVFISYIKKYIQ